MILALPLVRAVIFILWLVDVVTNFDARQVFKKIKKVTVYVISISFTGFIIYSYFSGFLNKVFTGYFNSQFFDQSMVAISHIPHPLLVQKQTIPHVSAKAFLVADRGDSRILYESHSDQRLASASTTKLMTALVALDLYNLKEVIEIPENCTQVNSTKIWLPQGFKFKVKDLIYSMLIGSAGDSACTLANGKVSYDKFVNLMNRKAFLIGLGNTHFSNPIGLDGLDGENYSTPSDLYKLASAVMNNPILSDAVKTKYYAIEDVDKRYVTRVLSTNQLLWEIPNTLGVKTGTTESAGEVFIYDYADAKKNLIIVVMGSQDRFADTKTLLNWALSSYSWD